MQRLPEVLGEIKAFVAERDWAPFHDPKNLAMALASEAGELLSLYRWVGNAEADAWTRDPKHRPAVEAEIADVAIMLLLLVDRAGIDLPAAIRAKLEVNRVNYPIEASRGRAERP